MVKHDVFAAERDQSPPCYRHRSMDHCCLSSIKVKYVHAAGRLYQGRLCRIVESWLAFDQQDHSITQVKVWYLTFGSFSIFFAIRRSQRDFIARSPKLAMTHEPKRSIVDMKSLLIKFNKNTSYNFDQERVEDLIIFAIIRQVRVNRAPVTHHIKKQRLF